MAKKTTVRKRARLPERLTVFCNCRDPRHKYFSESFLGLAREGVAVAFVPTSGCYTIWVHRKYMDGKRERETSDALYGPTAINYFLSHI